MNSKEIYVALIDSGCTFDTHDKVSIQAFNGEYIIEEQKKVYFKHGDAIGKILMENKHVKLLDIQIFQKTLSATAHHILASLNYLLTKKVDVINMSLGLETNYQEIEELCKLHIKNGTTIISSFPRNGKTHVFPASYENVISVTSDGKCQKNQISLVKENLFGASPLSETKGVAGSSVSVARFTKKYCDYLIKGYKKEEILNLFIEGENDETN